MMTTGQVERTRRPQRGRLPEAQPSPGKVCLWQDLGRVGYREAWDRQLAVVEAIKNGSGEDRLLFVEHPHVLTLGRNARRDNVLASPERLEQLGVEVHETDRGGDVTYHGPGQIVGYPIVNLTDWKKDVAAYMRGLEEVLIRVLADYGIIGERDTEATGVWVAGAKVAASRRSPSAMSTSRPTRLARSPPRNRRSRTTGKLNVPACRTFFERTI